MYSGNKRTTELSLVFVVVGMVFLFPVITGEALGHTKATVTASATVYNIHPGLVEKRLDEGSGSMNYIVFTRMSAAGQRKVVLSEDLKPDMLYTINTIPRMLQKLFLDGIIQEAVLIHAER